MNQQFPSLEEEFVVIERVKQGDHKAAAILYQWFGVPLFQQVILVRLPNIDKAEDVLRDCFRILFEKKLPNSNRQTEVFSFGCEESQLI